MLFDVYSCVFVLGVVREFVFCREWVGGLVGVGARMCVAGCAVGCVCVWVGVRLGVCVCVCFAGCLFLVGSKCNHK